MSYSHVPSLSLILLTHATPSHLAAFAHCCKHIPLFAQIPVYATQPVIYLGRTLLQDIYVSTPLAASLVPTTILPGPSANVQGPNVLLQPPSREEIASYFQSIHPLKYSQPHEPLASPFSPPLNGLTITAYNAGHSLGGTIWHLTHGLESVVYAVDWNQVRENVYNRAAWLSGGGGAEIIEQLQKPTALICSTRGVERTPLTGGRNKRDELLLENIRSTLEKGGTVLIPTDASARVLELAYIIEHAWRRGSNAIGDHPFKTTRVYLASKTIGTTIRFAKSMLEWMDESIVREAESDPAAGAAPPKSGDGKANPAEDNAQSGKRGQRSGPFDFKYIRLVERKVRLAKVIAKPGPKVIIASEPALSWGFSRDVFIHIADNPDNLVILTECNDLAQPVSHETRGIGQTLWQWLQDLQDGAGRSDGQTLKPVLVTGRTLTYREPIREPLEGQEIELYQQYVLTQRQLQDTSGLGGGIDLETTTDIVNEAASTSSSDSEESDSEQQGRALNYSSNLTSTSNAKATGKESLGVNAILSQLNTFDYDVRGKKGRESMFPYVTKRRRTDAFGDLIRPEDYLRAEERDEVDDTIAGQKDDHHRELGHKRKWGELDVLKSSGRRSLSSVRQQHFGAPGAETDASDHDLTSESDPDNDDDERLVPSKLKFEERSLLVSVRLAFVDFAGLHDRRNMSLLIPLIKPRKIVLIGGNVSETRYLATECRTKLLESVTTGNDNITTSSPGGNIFAPHNGQTIQASMDTNAWTVRLSEALVRRIRWQSVGGREVVTLTGNLAPTLSVESAQLEASRSKRPRFEGDTKSAAGVSAKSI